MTHEGHPFWDMFEGRSEGPPISRLLGLKVLSAEVGSGESEVQFEATDQFTTTGGRLQGGMLVAMLDEVMYAAACTVLETHEYTPTIDLTSSFIKPGSTGRLLGRGRVIKRGRSIAFVEGELFDSEGALICRATETCRVLSTREP